MKITDTDSLRAELEQFSPEQQREKTQMETQNTIEAIDNQLVSASESTYKKCLREE